MRQRVILLILAAFLSPLLGIPVQAEAQPIRTVTVRVPGFKQPWPVPAGARIYCERGLVTYTPSTLTANVFDGASSITSTTSRFVVAFRHRQTVLPPDTVVESRTS